VIFVDTSALIALVDRSDRHHGEAGRILSSLPPATRQVTTNLVLAETVTYFRRSQDAEIAFRVGRGILDSGLYRIVESSRDLEEEALELMRRFSDQMLSFVDCVSFALMREMRIESAFTFDDDFVRCGFGRLYA
jgi:predicted nucleic acid-binding protein